MNTVGEALKSVVKVDTVNYWLNFLIALYWVCQENKECKPFVQNRMPIRREYGEHGFWRSISFTISTKLDLMVEWFGMSTNSAERMAMSNP